VNDKKVLNKAALVWQCRRGLLELDLLLGPFVERTFDLLTEKDKLKLIRLLNHSDPDLQQWLLGQVPCPEPDLQPLIRKIQAQAKSKLLDNTK